MTHTANQTLTPAATSKRTQPPKTLRGPSRSKIRETEAALKSAEPHYRSLEFIATDPIQFAHRYRNDWHHCELVSFMTCLMAYGYRPTIIQTMDKLLCRMAHAPWQFVLESSAKEQKKALKGFVYRFYQADDIAYLVTRLKATYETYGSLYTLFHQRWVNNVKQLNDKPELNNQSLLQVTLAQFVDELIGKRLPTRYGSKHLFPHPAKGGACKRLHMFLRWVVREDCDLENPVDLGLWQPCHLNTLLPDVPTIEPKDLLIPVDTHVSSVSRQLGIISKRTDNWQTAEEITAFCRRLCPKDPVKYDFAFMGLGLNSP